MVWVKLQFPRWGCPFCLYLIKGAKPSLGCQVLQAMQGNKTWCREAPEQLALLEAGTGVATHLHGLPQVSQACLQDFLNGFSRRFDWWGRILIGSLVEAYNCTWRGDEPCYAVCHCHNSTLLSWPIIPQQSLGRATLSSTLKCWWTFERNGALLACSHICSPLQYTNRACKWIHSRCCFVLGENREYT